MLLEADAMEESKEMIDQTVGLRLSKLLIRYWLCSSMFNPSFCFGSNTERSETLDSTATTFSRSDNILSVGFALYAETRMLKVFTCSAWLLPLLDGAMILISGSDKIETKAANEREKQLHV